MFGQTRTSGAIREPTTIYNITELTIRYHGMQTMLSNPVVVTYIETLKDNDMLKQTAREQTVTYDKILQHATTNRNRVL